jgi:hypothetical protein
MRGGHSGRTHRCEQRQAWRRRRLRHQADPVKPRRTVGRGAGIQEIGGRIADVWNDDPAANIAEVVADRQRADAVAARGLPYWPILALAKRNLAPATVAIGLKRKHVQIFNIL